MNAYERWQWQMNLELKLYRLEGNAFQDFFSAVMEMRHKNDFVRVRPMGTIGDKGCDGYLRGTGRLYQCYGKMHDAALSAATIVGKIQDDYAKAVRALTEVLDIKEWHFVHNLHGGVPVVALEKIEELRKENPQHVLGLMGPPGFGDLIFALPEEEIVALLGPVASAADTENLHIEEVRDLVQEIIKEIDFAPITDTPPGTVPGDKLDFNGIAGHWRHILNSASNNTVFVQEYFSGHPDVEIGVRVAEVFKIRYRGLKAEGLAPDVILTALYEKVTGIGSVRPAQQVAAQALLAYLFDTCDIFENRVPKVTT